jgi:hypothetical protein
MILKPGLKSPTNTQRPQTKWQILLKLEHRKANNKIIRVGKTIKFLLANSEGKPKTWKNPPTICKRWLKLTIEG